ncbi:hypothetical protein V5F79_22245 [Xanthobacter flavus]|uniref:hypothetical protein n=1 Tax=Xanthobacter flavus TaxID=281 RepID=UPI0037283E2B
MSVATLIADMVRAGVDPEIIGRTAAALAEREPVKIVDEQAERRRAKDRERKRLRNSAESSESAEQTPPSLEGSSPTPPSPKTLPSPHSPPKGGSLPPQILTDCGPKKPALAQAFDQFRSAYPRRDGSQDWPKAREVFDRAVKSGVDVGMIVRGAELYAADCRRRGDEGGKFVKQARTWLNGRLWEEYSEAPPAIDNATEKPTGWPARMPDPETCFSAWRRGSWPPAWGFPPGDPDCPLPPAIVSDWQRRRDQAA